MKGYLCLLIIALLSCSPHSVGAQLRADKGCIRYPTFPAKLGFDLKVSALSTSEVRAKGLFLVAPSMNGAPRRSYQDPSWASAGALGGIVFNDRGDVFTYPVPHVNLLDNPPSLSNIIYRIDRDSGQMSRWVDLGAAPETAHENPYGLLGLAFSCAAKSFYASTVSGSTRRQERGKILQLDPTTGSVLHEIDNFDGFGVATAQVNGKPVLFVGHARSSGIFVVELNERGNFIGRPREIASIANLGPRGDDKVKKIQIGEGTQSLGVTGYEFHFNLSSTLIREESRYEVPLATFNEKLTK